MRKIGELMTDTAHFVIYHDDNRRCNPYRIYHKWYNCGWHRKLIAEFADLISCTFFINDAVMKRKKF